MGILRNEAADVVWLAQHPLNVLAKQAAGSVPLGDREKWMSGGGIRQWTRRRRKGYLEGKREKEEEFIKRAIGWKRLLQVEGAEGYREMVGKEDRTDRR